MKKNLRLIVYIFVFILITGCGKKQVICTTSRDNEGITMKTEFIIDLDDNNIVTNYKTIYDINDQEVADEYCNWFKTAYSTINVECQGSKTIMSGFDKLEDGYNEEEKLIGMTKEEFISELKELEDADFTCK